MSRSSLSRSSLSRSSLNRSSLNRSSLGRRRFLRRAAGLAAAGFSLPLLEVALNDSGTAKADGSALPMRFGVFFWGNGVHPETWTPAVTGPDWTVPEDWGLGPIISRSLKPHVSIINGLGMPGTHFPHVWPLPIVFSGAQREIVSDGNRRVVFRRPSVDQELARDLGMSPPIVAAVNRRPSNNATLIEPHLSWTGRDQPVVPEMDPTALFDQVFGNFTASPDDRNARQSVLDLVSGQLNSLKTTLGTTDSQRMDSHLTALRQLEQSLESAGNSCGSEPPGIGGHDVNDNSADGIRARNQAFVDIIALALACGARNTFSLMFTAGGDQTPLPVQQEYPSHGTHSLNHVGFGGAPSERERAQQDVQRTVNYQVDHFADLIETFANTQEVTGESLLDSSAMIATTDCWWGNNHSTDPFTVLVAGGARGGLRMGHHIQVDGTPPPSEVTLSVVRAIRAGAAVDSPSETYGEGADSASRGISELEV